MSEKTDGLRVDPLQATIRRSEHEFTAVLSSLSEPDQRLVDRVMYLSHVTDQEVSKVIPLLPVHDQISWRRIQRVFEAVRDIADFAAAR